MKENETKKKGKEKMSYQEHIGAPLSTHLILLERFRQDVTNHTLQDYQTRL